LYVAGKRKQYTFIIPDPHPGPLQILVYEIIKHQGDVVMTLGILDTNITHTTQTLVIIKLDIQPYNKY
jgi:hypothetical protein